MKTAKLLSIVLIIILLFNCKKSTVKKYSYEFTNAYCAQITVGGFVGIKEKCFSVGEIIEGTPKNNGTVSVRIAEHSQKNEEPANSSSYQEFLDIPIANLKLIGR